jgi:hypothetical protein
LHEKNFPQIYSVDGLFHGDAESSGPGKYQTEKERQEKGRGTYNNRRQYYSAIV